MSGAIAIFVKTPEHSPVKTRLAATIGEAAARCWYERAAATVAAVARAAATGTGAVAYFAVAETKALAAERWAGAPCLAQGDGGLGARMGRVHAELVRRHGAGVLLGADAPQLPVGALADALAWCAATEPRQALGPARDGGFWLYGGNRVVPLATWESVPYSEPETAARFRTAFAAHGALRILPALTDVDHESDLSALRRELAALAESVPEQRALGAWLDAAFPGAAGTRPAP
jgi:glycosyltransferase A (GT-A) superfamily protein (DUF2064 family)